ncbi:MAG: GNAT family N-acetyltransferase [Fidelibacterota bacterium]|nr:MAG: GNAT family N-acetyltransferase [Candidatus Neomarinimicrobiota bacterium]
MKKVIKLKDGAEAIIRKMRKEDIEKSLVFFRALPEEDRKYLRRDITKREVVRERINAMQSGRVKRLVAVLDDQIIADGSLELETQEWKKHIGEIRLIVARPFQHKGLGMLMARELYLLAARKKVEVIVVQMMRPQVAAISIFHRLGFSEDATLTDYVEDLSGSKQDLIVMRCDLKALMKEMEDYVADSDWERTR